MGESEMMRLIDSLTAEERDKLREKLWKRREEDSPKMSVRIGQIIKWMGGTFPESQRIGIASSTESGVTSIVVMEYMPEFKCLACTRVDAIARGLEITDKFVDLSEVVNGYLR